MGFSWNSLKLSLVSFYLLQVAKLSILVSKHFTKTFGVSSLHQVKTNVIFVQHLKRLKRAIN